MKYYLPVIGWEHGLKCVKSGKLREIVNWCRERNVRVETVDVLIDSAQPDIQYKGVCFRLVFVNDENESLFLMLYQEHLEPEETFAHVGLVTVLDNKV